MVVERAELLAKPGSEDPMLAAMIDRGVPLLCAQPGVVSVRVGRGVESPDKFLLLVEWTDLAAHTAFTRTTVFTEFRTLLMPLSRGGAMEHFDMDCTAAR